MESIHLTDLEAAINHWRQRAPSGPGASLSPQVAALAEVYAQLVYQRRDAVAARDMGDVAMQAWLAWWETTPDTPCIAICSTSQGDEVCKGCGRSFDEVQHWLAYSPMQKRAVWRRISLQGTAWRFNRYAERARSAGGITSSE
ncbi:DUF3717 domain-containing protein [Comamonas sp. JUb58]|uniref:DUF3717 domain-containing protein n=1 Tax=Comamonas sp. JUb58 TaxID=2485114 RepID=UPI00105C9284|nr:DUF3717 domain-containing protein [Comamonas sp. JUb58]TDS82510.1 hypothetical protein EDF71_107146 [Comamonas sp. JUb58]